MGLVDTHEDVQTINHYSLIDPADIPKVTKKAGGSPLTSKKMSDDDLLDDSRARALSQDDELEESYGMDEEDEADLETDLNGIEDDEE